MTAPASLSTTTQISSPIESYFHDQLLLRQKPYQIAHAICQTDVHPHGESDVGKWRIVKNLLPATTPLTEGVPPPGQQIVVSDITVNLKQYGDYVTISDKVTFITKSPTLNYNTELLAQQMGETHDLIIQDAMAATPSVYTCTNGTNGKVVNGSACTEISQLDVQMITRNLRKASGKMFTPLVEGQNKVGTSPVEKAYWALGHTDTSIDLRNIPQFLHTSQYPMQKTVMDAEWGSLEGARFLLSPLFQMTQGTASTANSAVTNPNTYQTYFSAQNAVGVTKINEGTTNYIFKRAGDGYTGGPLNQWGTQGWKSYFAALVLQPAWLIKATSTLKV